MASIKAVGVSLPEYRYSVKDIESVGQKWLASQPDQLRLFERFLHSSKAENRYFVIPPEEILLSGGLKNRAELFERYAPQLGTEAVNLALAQANISKEEIEAIVFTSCSIPTIPCVDGLIVEQSGIQRSVIRLPIFQHGCAGGVIGLQLAARLAALNHPTLLVSVELCSLVFHPENPTAAQLVGAAIFADGAACAVIMHEKKGLVFKAMQSYLLPDSRDLMGYNLLDDGFHLRLDRELPQRLITVAPQKIAEFLESNGLKAEEIDYWLFHPGGTKILDFFEEHLKLRAEQAYWARSILSTIGNLSSATILFVVSAFLNSKVCKPGDKVLVVGIGPGLTLELILLEWSGA